ncbi:MAG: crotonase/enoyl-CoA hydratase family protein [Deltaproteobacteria bacterium]|nr:MAG: crotonase/enoyl-CoA hydratase family protein [Deltaproteobacteria bacterium]
MSEAYPGLVCETNDQIAHVYLNRPNKRNAMDLDFWDAMIEMFNTLNYDRDVRVIILSGRGKSFCAGLDLTSLASVPGMDMSNQTPMNRMDLVNHIRRWQEAMNVVERCRKPVIAAIHGACVGGGLDLVSACDIRLASSDAYFSLREAAMAMVADLGSLQRLPLIIGQGLTRELAFTARDVSSDEALQMRLVNRLFPTFDELMEGAEAMARSIAAQSPLAVQSSKETLNYSRHVSVEDGLHYAVTRNSMIMPSADLVEAFQAFMEKRKPNFPGE